MMNRSLMRICLRISGIPRCVAWDVVAGAASSRPSVAVQLAAALRQVMDALEPAAAGVQSKHSSFAVDSGTATSTSVSTLSETTSVVCAATEGFTLDEELVPATDRGLCGLSNLGNTCFLNAVIQALSNVPAFARQFAEVPFPIALPAGSLPLEFSDVLRAIWSGRYGRIAPSGVFRNLRRLNPMFDGYDQHDAQEALRFLINDMHDKLSVDVLMDDALSPPVSPVVGYACTPLSTEYSRPVWMDTGPYMGPPRSQQSVISDIFRGSLYSTVTCKSCGASSTTRDFFYDLSLPIPKRRVAPSSSVVSLSPDGRSTPVTEPEHKSSMLSSVFCKLFGTGGAVRLSDCLHAFFDAEPLTGVNQYECERCKTKCDAEKSLSLSQLPETLCLHLKRFSYHSVWGSKVSSHVQFPLEGLDVSPWLRTDRHSPPKSPSVYDLTSIVVHVGGMSGGHYIAYGRNRLCGKWYQFDDGSVSPTSPVDVASEQAYILFYTRRRMATVPVTVAPSPDPYCYVSKQWLIKAVSMVHPGPATAHPVACEHMHVKQELLSIAPSVCCGHCCVVLCLLPQRVLVCVFLVAGDWSCHCLSHNGASSRNDLATATPCGH
jgi:ubiquitin C-terminal hydrolase